MSAQPQPIDAAPFADEPSNAPVRPLVSPRHQAVRRLTFCLLCSLLALGLGVVSRIGQFGAAKHYVGFTPLTWETSEHCRIQSDSYGPHQNMRRIVTTPEDSANPGNVAECVSTWMPLKGQFVELEYFGYRGHREAHKVAIQIETSTGETVRPIVTPFRQRTKRIFLSPRFVSADPAGVSFRLRVLDRDGGSGWIGMRDKVDFYNANSLSLRIAQVLENQAFRNILLAATIGLLVLAGAIFLTLRAPPAFCSILFFAAIAGSIHFEPSLYFYGDDVMFISHFFEQGIAGFLRSHNEHVLPVFFALFILEYFAFLGSYELYLTLSLVIQGINCLLFLKLCSYIFPNTRSWQIAATGAAIFYALHGLHVEVLQWATCQSIMLAVTFRLTSYLLAFRYLRLRANRDLILSALAGLCSMFCYGGGILTPLEVLVVPFLAQQALCSSGRLRVGPWRLAPEAVRLWILTLASFTVGGITYTVFRNGIGYTVTKLELPSFHEYLTFALLGSQFGAVFRGFGLDYAIPFRAIEAFFPSSWQPLVASFALPIALGLAVNLVLLWLAYRTLGRQGLIVWCFSQLLVTAHFFLIGLGRTEWVGGPRYSMTPRYHTEAILGLAIILVPALYALVERLRSMMVYRRKLASIVLSIVVVAFVWRQFEQVNNFAYYRERSNNNRRYVEQVGYWLTILGPDSVAVDGSGTPFAGLYPIYHERNPTWDTVPTHDLRELVEMFITGPSRKRIFGS